MQKNIAAIILAAGKGARMKSETPKVLHTLCGRPMLDYVLDSARDLKIKKSLVVLGYKHKTVKKSLPAGVDFVIQKKLLGTADAVKSAMPKLKSFKGTVLILYGDIPLLKKETLLGLLKYHARSNADATLLTAQLDKPEGYGRILRDAYSSICGIVEEKDADDFQKDIKEINTGIICFNKDKLAQALKEVRPDNRKKEFYLTDIISILYKKNCLIEGVRISDINEALGINSREDLSKANKIMQQRINAKLMEQGVSIIDPNSTFISYGTRIGRDTVIYPFTVIERDVKIGKHCSVGPFAHLREGAELADSVVAGNFLEIVRSRLGSKTFVKHFCYIGDSRIGRMVNIGAGTVTANFDGKGKGITVIKDGAYIGSDTILIAPVKIGRNARTGAGTVVLKNKDIPDGKVGVGVPVRLLTTKR